MRWTSSFSYLPIDYGIPLARVEDQTQRVIFDNNLNGRKVRLHFSNRYSSKPLTLDRVSVGIVKDGRIENACAVLLNGNPVIELGPGEECFSDELEYSVSAGEKIAVSTYVRDLQEIGSICSFWSSVSASVTLSASGDYTSGGVFADYPAEEVYQIVRDDPNGGFFFYGFSGLQVLTDERVKTIAAFGDSITHMSYITSALYKRLAAAYPGQVTLVNRGIGGNRVLYDATYSEDIVGNGRCFGTAGIKRFEQDVFGEEHVDAVLVLEGINDIMHPLQFGHPDQQVTADELIEGFRQYIETAHSHHARIYGATITPSGNEEHPEEWRSAFETVRLETNDRIRSGIGYDGFFDYDEAVREPGRPAYMKEECHLGDGLHPNDAGGAIMAGRIDIDQIMRECGHDSN